MKTLQRLFENILLDQLVDSDIDLASDEGIDFLSDATLEVIAPTVDLLWNQFERDARSLFHRRSRTRKRFEKELKRHWRRPLSLLDLFIQISTESGDDFNKEMREEVQEREEAVLDVLTFLHGRGCQIALEILTLLRSGFADGAHARWRSLHEIAVIGQFVAKYGQETAEQYRLHDSIQRLKLVEEHRAYEEKLDEEPIPQDEYDVLRQECEELELRFGRSFRRDYGWATSALQSEHVTFRDIEQDVELDLLRPYYRMASDNIHANAHGIYFRLGLDPDREPLILAGPSDMGLETAAQMTAISLNQITIALLTTRSILDDLVISKFLLKFGDIIGEAFLQVSDRPSG